jgi:hypothetical protein
MSFLSEEQNKPKLTEIKLIKQIILEQKQNTPQEEKIFKYILKFSINNYIVILTVIVIILSLYWRYLETKEKKEKHKIYYDDEIN